MGEQGGFDAAVTKRARRGIGLGCATVWLVLACTAGGAFAQEREGVNVGKRSAFANLVPAQDVEKMAGQQYKQVLQQADSKNALAPPDNEDLRRLRTIAQRLIPFAKPWNERASQWQWEVNLIGSKQINAYCMPGGKIAFYTGILRSLQLSDDEAAMVMGHEMAHALREHARERMGKSTVTTGAARLGGALLSGWLGVDPNLTDMVAQQGANLLNLKFGREDESEADLVGMEIAARAGYDPRAGISLWEKMGAANKGAPPQWLSTHPASSTRIADMQAALPSVMPLFERAKAASSKP
jgi:predicted Zn-dependent protease